MQIDLLLVNEKIHAFVYICKEFLLVWKKKKKTNSSA